MSTTETLITALLLDMGEYAPDAKIEQNVFNAMLNVLEKRNNFQTFIKELPDYNYPVPKDVYAATLYTAIFRANDYKKSSLAEITKFEYVGPKNKNDLCAKFCHHRLGKTFKLHRIEAMNNGKVGSVLFFGGGWGCTHTWEADPF